MAMCLDMDEGPSRGDSGRKVPWCLHVSLGVSVKVCVHRHVVRRVCSDMWLDRCVWTRTVRRLCSDMCRVMWVAMILDMDEGPSRGDSGGKVPWCMHVCLDVCAWTCA